MAHRGARWAFLSTFAFVLSLRALGSATRLGSSWGVWANVTSVAPQPAEMALMSAGFGTLRIDLLWPRLEIQGRCGVYNWALAQGWVDAAVRAGLRLFLSLSGTSPCYADPDGGCTSPACVSGFGNWTRAVRSLYKSRGYIFECLSGGDDPARQLPVTSYVALCALAAPAFNSTKEIFLGPGITTPTSVAGLSYLDQVLSLGMMDEFRGGLTGISIHHDGSSRSCMAAPPEAMIMPYAAVSATIWRHATSDGQLLLPVVSGSWGYPSISSAAPGAALGAADCDPQTQGKYLARTWLVNMLAGVRTSIWSTWRDAVPGTGGRGSLSEANVMSASGEGVIVTSSTNASAPSQVKPAFLAAVALQQTIGSCGAYVGRAQALAAPASALSPVDVFALQFSGVDGPTFAVWSNASRTCDVQALDRTPCGGLGSASMATVTRQYACLAAGCCFDGATGGCFTGRASEAVSSPTGMLPHLSRPGGVCWNVTDTFGFPRGSVCARGNATHDGVLSMNVSDAPLYLTPLPILSLSTATAVVLPGQSVTVVGTGLSEASLFLCPAGDISPCTPSALSSSSRSPLPRAEHTMGALDSPMWPVDVASVLSACSPLATVQRNATGIISSIPVDSTPDAWTVVAVDDDGIRSSNCLAVNVPIVSWMLVDRPAPGNSGYPGGSFSLFGKALRFSDTGTDQGFDCPPLFPTEGVGAPNVTETGKLMPVLGSAALPLPVIGLASADSPPGGRLSTVYPCTVTLASCFRVDAIVPPNTPPGNYSVVYLSNGLPATAGSAGAIVAQLSVASAPYTRPAAAFIVGTHCPLTNISICLMAANASGGGTVIVPRGFYAMPRNAVLLFGTGVQLVGMPAASGASDAANVVLAWSANPPITQYSPDLRPAARFPPALVTGVGDYWGLHNLTLLVTSSQQFTVRVFNSVGVRISGVIMNVTVPANISTTPMSPVYVRSSQQWEVSNCTFYHHISCGANFPYTYHFVSDLAVDGVYRNNHADYW